MGSSKRRAQQRASKQRDERTGKQRVDGYAVRLAPSPDLMGGTPADLRKHRERQLLRAQAAVAQLRETLGIDSNEVVHIKQELLNTQQKLRATELELDEAREKLRAHKSHERSATSNTRALSRRTHEQRDYIAAVEQQLTTTRAKLQVAESRIAELMEFRQHTEQLTHQLGQERQRSREKDDMISELEQREEELQRQIRTLILQRDEAPGRKDMRHRMQRMQIRENAMEQVLAAVAGTVRVVDVPSRAWEDEEPILSSPMWQQLEPEPQSELLLEQQAGENAEQSTLGMRCPQPPEKRSTGNSPRKIGRTSRRQRRSRSKLQGKKIPIEQMKRRLRAMSYSTKGQDPASLFALYDANNSGSLELDEFRSAVRKGGQVTSAVISDDELETLFGSVDSDADGNVSIHELTNFIWGEGQHISALLEQELQGFAKALDTSSDDDDGDNEVEYAREGSMEEQEQGTDGKVYGKNGSNEGAGKRWKQPSDGGRSPQTPLYSPTTGRLLRRPRPRTKKDASSASMMPTPEELTQLRWGSSKLVDGQEYWFHLNKPAELYWTVPPELVAALRRLRAEAKAKAMVAAAGGVDGEGFFVA